MIEATANINECKAATARRVPSDEPESALAIPKLGKLPELMTKARQWQGAEHPRCPNSVLKNSPSENTGPAKSLISWEIV
jgi:hypothetical protein